MKKTTTTFLFITLTISFLLNFAFAAFTQSPQDFDLNGDGFLDFADADEDNIMDTVDLQPDVVSTEFIENSTPSVVTNGFIDTEPPPPFTTPPTPIPYLYIILYSGGNGVQAVGALELAQDVRIVACDGASAITMPAGANTIVHIFCGSSNIHVMLGTVNVAFYASNGTTFSANIPAGNGIKFIPETATFIAPETNESNLTIEIEGAENDPIVVAPGETKSILSGLSILEISLPPAPLEVNTLLSVRATFTDSDDNEEHAASWDWGDNSEPSTGTISYNTNAPNEVIGEHTYTSPGVYTVTLTVTNAVDNEDTKSSTEDDDGTTSYIVIYDPDGGFVTGGGWIHSPENAFIPNPGLTGKATFGFVSKYVKGKSIPEGQTEFQFKAGDLNFHSSLYDWLVINHHKAMYKGAGTINGTGNYGFQLSAIDAELTSSTSEDLFRLRIWDKENNDALIYDNQSGDDPNSDPATALGGGNIKIHDNTNGNSSLNAATQSAVMTDPLANTAVLTVFPNPFKDYAEIQFRLLEESQVGLSIFDLSGREIPVLRKNMYSAGVHKINWDGRDNSGRRLPSGFYILKMQMNNHPVFQQIVLKN